jgi:hypothetical protein
MTDLFCQNLEVAVDTSLVLSSGARGTAGILLLTIVAVEYGGWFMLGIVRGRTPLTDFQKTFARAGHAHAGVLVILSLVCQIYADATHMSPLLSFLAHSGVPIAAILMPAGFFISSAGKDLTQPNRFIVLLYAGIVSLAVGVISLGLGLLTT